MRKIESSWLLALTEANYWDELGKLPNELLVVKCDNGDVTIHRRMLQWCNPILDWVRVHKIPCLVELFPHVDDIPTEDVYLDLMSENLKHAFNSLNFAIPLVDLAGQGIDIARQINNHSRLIEEYTVALDAEDYSELLYSPGIVDIRNELLARVDEAKTPKQVGLAISDSYNATNLYVSNYGLKLHEDNGLVQLMTSKTGRAVQLNQGIGVVGYGSEVDSSFLPKPILTNYARGLNSVYSFAANASSGAKSLMYSHTPMRTTEYLHRLTQQVSACFNDVHFGDCGSTITRPLVVTKENSKYIVGKYYLVDGVLNEVTAANHKSLIGTTIQARGVTGCLVPDKTAVCTACAGSVSLAIRSWASVGWTYTTATMSVVSQGVLAAKHSDMTSVGESVAIAPALIDHLVATDDTRGLKFVSSGYQLGFKFKKDSPNVIRLDEILAMSEAEFSSIKTWDFLSCYDIMVQHTDGITISYDGLVLDRREEVTLSRELLRWIRINPDVVSYTYLARRTLSVWVDLTDYPLENRVLVTRFAHYDMLKLFKGIETFIKGSSKTVKGSDDYITDFNSFGAAANRLWDIYSHKMPINLNVLELMLYSFSVNDPAGGDWSPYRGDGICYFAPLSSLFANRSLSTLLGAEGMHNIFAAPSSTTVKTRFPSHYDPFFVPQT